MHAIIKSSFYIIFIILSLGAGVTMLTHSKGGKSIKLYGFMVLFLGIGESFHLVPRILEIFTENTETYGTFIDTGRFIASMTIIVVYLVLLWFMKVHYKVSNTKNLDIILFILAIVGVSLSVIFKDSENTLLILLRNMPTIVIGGIIVFSLKKQAIEKEKTFKYLWLAILLSLLFTIGFELLSGVYPVLIILMMPKTLMYIWIVIMGYTIYRNTKKVASPNN